MADDDTTIDPSADTPQTGGVEAQEADTPPAAAKKAAAKRAPAKKAAAKKAPAKKAAAKKAPAKKAATKKASAKKAAAADTPDESLDQPLDLDTEAAAGPAPAAKAPAKKASAKKAATKRAPAKRTTTKVDPAPEPIDVATDDAAETGTETGTENDSAADAQAAAAGTTTVLFQTPTTTTTTRTRRRSAAARSSEADASPSAGSAEPASTDPVDGAAPVPEPVGDAPADDQDTDTGADTGSDSNDDDSTGGTRQRSGRSRGGRGRGRSGSGTSSETDGETGESEAGESKSGDSKSGDSKSGDSKASESKAGDSKAGDSKSADDTSDDDHDESDDNGDGGQGGGRRRRRRGGRRRRRGGGDGSDASSEQSGRSGGDDDRDAQNDDQQGAGNGSKNGSNGAPSDDGDDSGGGSGSSRRRRRRRREGDDAGNGAGNGGDDPSNTTTRVRRSRSPEDEITAISGSTRLEAKKQRRRDGREAGRRRAPIVSEAEFLSRRESVERVMTIRQRDDLTQIGVLEDKVLVEHYVARESQTSLIGNVYLGRVQNVLPSMEAAFIDIGKGRNAVLYAGEVNWSALGHKDGAPRKIESVLSSGQTILVQVSKDPIGHKGARLTSQISLAGRFLVYVPDGTTSGISRKLPDTERSRLKTLLKEIVPDSAGVIVRTAAEGASEQELTSDVERLKARWEDIEAKAAKSGGTAKSGGSPQLLYGEPDLTLKVVRDLFTEDFAKLVVQGDTAWETVSEYVAHVAPDLQERLERHDGDTDLFSVYRVDEQIAKALDRKVWLPSGGSLVIDRTEAMTVVDVNTGKFTGSGGNLEETVTKNNLEAAEEVVRQLRLRDIGGIIVVDFIDMVLESNRDLVLRRLVECLGRDRTRHQVAEVTSLGLVQMTRKRIGTGLLEAFSESCSHCQGYGVVVHDAPVEPKHGDDDSRGGGGGGRRRGGRGRSQDSDHGSSGGNGNGSGQGGGRGVVKPTPAEFAAMVKSDSSPAEESGADPRGETSPPASETPSEKPAEKSIEQPGDGPDETSSEVTSSAPSTTVSTRTRGGGSRSARRSEAASAPEPATVEPEPAPQQAPEPAPEATAPEAQPEPAAEVDSSPKVVTRSRRGVTRTVATTAPVTPVVPDSTPAEPAAAEPATTASTPEPPKVSTRTRGRRTPAASSVPPAAVGDVGSPARSGAVEPADVDVEPGGDSPLDQPLADSTEHVPVKRRTRRR